MNKLDELRAEIDSIDEGIIQLLNKRFLIAKKIALYKKENNLQILDLKREQYILDKVKTQNECLISIYQEILKKSKLAQEEV